MLIFVKSGLILVSLVDNLKHEVDSFLAGFK